MKRSLEDALKNTDTTYNQLIEIANGMVKIYTGDIDCVVQKTLKVENLTNDDIRNIITELSLKAYQFGDVKEKSALKAECAEALRKEAYAKEFSLGDGSIAAKDTNATLNISSEIMTEAIYNLVASLFKTRLDECHRIVDTLKTVLMSRMQEAKLSTSTFSAE